MTQTDPYSGQPYPNQQYPDQHSTPTQIGSPYGQNYGQDYGALYQGAPGYGASPGDAYGPGTPPGYPPPSPSPSGSRPGFGPAAVVGIVVVIAVLLAGLGTGAYFLFRPATTPAPTPIAAAPSAPSVPSAAAPAPSAPASPAAPAAPSGTTSGATSLSQVFPASTGSACVPYTPAAGEYVTSTGRQATEVRACAAGGSGDSSGTGVVYTRWASPADAASVVSDQATTTTSVNGKNTWTMGGATQGDYHEARQSDGSCRAFLDYTSARYAVVFSAPSCSAVEQLFQDTTLPDVATLPR